MRNIVVVGNGGLAREIHAMIERINNVVPRWNFLGYVINDRVGEDVFCNDEKLLTINEELDVIIALGNANLRKKIYEKLCKNANLSFPSIIDPSVLITGQVDIAEGTMICPGCVLTVDIKIGRFCLINIGSTIAHDDVLDDYVSINPGCNLSGNVNIGTGTEVGTGSQIVQKINIGRDVDIWAGSTVIKSIKDKCVVVGVPAKVIMHKE